MEDQQTKEKYSYGYAMSLHKPFKEKEKAFEINLSQYEYCIMRFDGSGMTSAFKIKHKAIHEGFFQTMRKTFYSFIKKYSQIIFAYSFSDEISILFRPSNNRKSIFSRNQKLLSLLAAQLTLDFKKAAEEEKLKTPDRDWIFDARIIGCNQNEVIDYFISRQAFAIDKYLMQLKGEYGVDYKLHTSKVVIKALQEKGIDYQDFNAEYKYGLMYSLREKQLTPFDFADNIDKLKSATIGKNKAACAQI